MSTQEKLKGLNLNHKAKSSNGVGPEGQPEDPFVQRSRKVTGDTFFDTLFFNEVVSHKDMSLNSMCVEYYKRTGQTITKQSLNERFNQRAVCFMKSIVSDLLQPKGPSQAEQERIIHDKHFNRVIIKDATSFDLPHAMRDKYKGSGGAASPSCAKIQLGLDLKTYTCLDLSINPYVATDTKEAVKTLGQVESGDLYIQDLGYYSAHYIQEMDRRNAYYIFRNHPSQLVYTKQGDDFHPIDFGRLRQHMSRCGLETMEKDVFVSAAKVPVRMVIKLAPLDLARERIRAKNQYSKKKGRQMKERSKDMCHFNIFITNVKHDVLCADQVHQAYRMRWQMELLFKALKSVLKINMVGRSMKVERFECFLIAKLINLIVKMDIFNRLNEFSWKENRRILSLYKSLILYKSFAVDFYQGIRLGDLAVYFKSILLHLPSCFLESKKGKTGYLDVMDILEWIKITDQ